MKDYKIVWDKLKLPNDKEEDEEEDTEEENYEYSEEEVRPNFHIAQILSGGENPFVQLKTFNFWTAHTNFRINKEVAAIVWGVDGVESLDVISPYRFHVSVGRVFDEQQVKREIYAKLYEFLNESEQQFK